MQQRGEHYSFKKYVLRLIVLAIASQFFDLIVTVSGQIGVGVGGDHRRIHREVDFQGKSTETGNSPFSFHKTSSCQKKSFVKLLVNIKVVTISSCFKYGSSLTTKTRPLLFSLKIQEFYQKISHIFPNLGLYSKISNVHHIQMDYFF